MPQQFAQGNHPGLPSTKRISVLGTASLKQLDSEWMLNASFEEAV